MDGERQGERGEWIERVLVKRREGYRLLLHVHCTYRPLYKYMVPTIPSQELKYSIWMLPEAVLSTNCPFTTETTFILGLPFTQTARNHSQGL
jgi:hypothetical protein